MSGTTPVSIDTRSKHYKTPTKPVVENDATNTPSTSTPPSSDPLHIEWPSNDSIIQPPPKGVLQKSSYNPIVQASYHYNIVEDLAQEPLVMLDLEVL